MRKREKKRSSKIDLKLNRIESNKNENEKAHNRQKHVEHNNTTQKRDFDSQ